MIDNGNSFFEIKLIDVLFFSGNCDFSTYGSYTYIFLSCIFFNVLCNLYDGEFVNKLSPFLNPKPQIKIFSAFGYVFVISYALHFGLAVIISVANFNTGKLPFLNK